MRMFAPVSRLTTRLDSVVDWFLPASLAADKVMRKQARLFLISHLCGPFIGNTVPLALYIFDPTPSWDIAVLCASSTMFSICRRSRRATWNCFWRISPSPVSSMLL